jgi:hypothetical protein
VEAAHGVLVRGRELVTGSCAAEMDGLEGRKKLSDPNLGLPSSFARF